MNHKDFISKSKSMLIAPAGHGKTHSIVECLNHTEGRQLILTHTHAGVASIKEKIEKAKLSSNKFHIETITGYAQKYMQAYYTGIDIPDREDPEAYYSFLLEKAKKIIKSPLIECILKSSYSGLFVDEYQDCTLQQHELISIISEILPTRIFGDPLQGIFNFNGNPMVNLNDDGHMGEFHGNKYQLEEPWRWKGINEPLGKGLKEIRVEIEAKNSFDLRRYPAIEFIHIADENDLYNPQQKYYRDVNKILSAKNLLIIHPESSSINPRKKIVSIYKTPITLVEAIDDKAFYSLAKLFDNIDTQTIEKIIYKVCLELFNKTEVNLWLSEKGAKNRTKESKETASELTKTYAKIKEGQPYLNCSELLKKINKLKSIRCYRKELLSSLCAALEEASATGKTVNESMIDRRNHIRQIGRKIYGRCIGTTLLTKGLEFETVVILNAHKFTCPKNLYVALTRASKRLIVFSKSPVFSPTY